MKENDRQYMRVAAKQTTEAKRMLQNFLEFFLKDCIAKDEKEIKRCYVAYENMWIEKCKTHRRRNKIRQAHNQVIELLEDAFETSCNSGRESIVNLNIKSFATKEEKEIFEANICEYKRIFRIVEHKTTLGKFAYWCSKHFFVTSTKYKLNGDLKKQLNPVT